MALILDESFDAGIPSNFATARAQSGTLTATFNATSGAVDLSNATFGQNIWDITSQALMVSGEMEIDLELVADLTGTNNIRHAGLWLVAGEVAVSNGFRFAHNVNTPTNLTDDMWAAIAWTGGNSWSGNASQIQDTRRDTTIPFTTVGDRRVLNARWDMTAQTAGRSKLTAEFRVDGKLVSYGIQTFTSLRPGIFLYASTVRLHSIKVWDAPQAPLQTLSWGGFDDQVARLVLAPPEALVPGAQPTNISRELPLGLRNTYFGGNGRITGTVKEKALPNNMPLQRMVRLLDERTGIIVGETWSDKTTGNYVFENIEPNRKYTVLTYDYALNYRAVIADNLTPTSM